MMSMIKSHLFSNISIGGIFVIIWCIIIVSIAVIRLVNYFSEFIRIGGPRLKDFANTVEESRSDPDVWRRRVREIEERKQKAYDVKFTETLSEYQVDKERDKT